MHCREHSNVYSIYFTVSTVYPIFLMFLLKKKVLICVSDPQHVTGCLTVCQLCHFNTACVCVCLTEEEAELAVRCQSAEHLLKEQQCVMVAARDELQVGRARASALSSSIREEERCFLEELKRRSHKITLLSRELQRQNVITTGLCHQLHSARLKVFQQRQSGEKEEAGVQVEEAEEEPEEEDEDDNEDEEEEDNTWLMSPTPPASPAKPQARHGGRASSVREERVRACVPLERVTAPQRPQPMPDPALFLVPLRYRLLRLGAPSRLQAGEEELEDEWEDIEDSRVHGRVDMGAGEGETAL